MGESDATPPRAVRPWPVGWTVEHVSSTGSTNADLLATVDRRPDRSVLVTDHQTAGRGRLDRRWDASPGTNLLVSLLFHLVPDRPSELTRRVALAAIAACAEVAGVQPSLKWPNDVVLDGAKLAGILAERAASGSVVVGLGLNVGWAPEGAARLGDGIEPLDVLVSVLAAFDALPIDVDRLYRQQLATLGQRVRVERLGDVIDGTATDVEPDGCLVVVDTCGITHRLDVGDVIHLR